MNLVTRVENELTTRGCSVSRLSKRENGDRLYAWRRKFAMSVCESTGRWVKGDYDWHVFSFGFTPCMDGQAALDMLIRVPAPLEYTVQSAWTGSDFGFVCTGPLLRSPIGRIDLLISPASLEWTLAFTHEPGFGPYFVVAGDE